MERVAFALVSGVVALTLLAVVGLTDPPSTGRAAAEGATPAPSSVTPLTQRPGDGAANPAGGSGPDQPTNPFREREDDLALMVGRTRVAAGLMPLARSHELDRAARAHAQDMSALGYMEHEAPDGSTPGMRAAQEGYDTPPAGAWLVVETISAISDQPEGPVAWWLSDGLHRRVLLRPSWREIGVGFAPGGPYGRFWVALFGCRPNVLPPILLDGVLAVPDENCARTGDAFGSVESLRVGTTSAAAHGADWEPYTAQRPWPTGRPAVVDMRDAAGHELEIRAADPTGAQTQAP